MGKRRALAEHFSVIAGQYRDVRTTDEEPVRFIRDALAGRAAIAAANIGCGAGRYDLLLFLHLPNLHLTCVDSSPEMLAELSRYLAGEGIADFETIHVRIEDLDLGKQSLDCVFTFNAVHHFDFPGFIAKAGGLIRDDGRIFSFTPARPIRTPTRSGGGISRASARRRRASTGWKRWRDGLARPAG